MRLKRLTASNAKQYHDVDLDLSQVRLASIIGNYTFNRSKSNGAGKSTLGDLIMFALFETVPDKSLNTSDLVSWGAGKMKVSLEFEYEGNQYLIKRTHTPDARTKNKMDLEINGVPQGKDIIERRKILAENLGITDQIAQATWFFQQSGANKLTTADPKDRKEYLAAVLDADKYDKAYVYAKEKAGEVERDIELARKAASQLEEVIKNIEDGRRSQQGFQEQKKNSDDEIAKLQSKLDDVNNKLAVIASQRGSVESEESLQAKLGQANSNLASAQRMKAEAESSLIAHQHEMSEARKTLQQMEDAKAQADKDYVEITSKWAALNYTEDFLKDVNRHVWDFKLRTGKARDRLKEIKAQISGTSELDVTCPTCGQEVGDDHRAARIRILEQEAAQVETQLQQDEAQLQEMYKNETLAQEDDSKLKQAKSIINSHASTYGALTTKIQSSAAIEQSTRQQIEVLSSQIATAQASIADLTAKLEESKRVASVDDQQLLVEKRELQLSIERERSKADESAAQATRWEAHIESLMGQKQQMEEASANLSELEEELKARQTVVQLFHRDGLPLSKIKSACSLIEAYANSMMSTVLPNYHLKVEVESGKRGKLDFMVNTPGGLQPYAVLSGGEKAIAGLCLRMALSRILAEGSGHRFETLFLDEVFSELDQVYRPVMMNLVKELSKSFKAIYVISHELEIQTAFPQVVLVECDGKQSHVRVLENNEVE